MKSRKAARAHSRGHWKRWLLGFAVLAAILPIIGVALVRWWEPPFTPLMVLREMEARREHRAIPDRSYRWIPLERMPRDFLHFVFIAEDQRFFSHHGFDWREVEIAKAQARRTGKKPRGASTITMQCARSIFLWQERSWLRKGMEAYFTFWMEALLPKRRIFELYANVIELGDGVYGIEAAARAHFEISAQNLSREQCAALAAMLPNPRQWDPHQPSPKLAVRIAKILRQEKHVDLPRL